MSKRSAHADRCARHLARAFLAGEWEPRSMGRRAKRAVGDQRHWPTRLAEVVHVGFPDKPVDRPREVAAFIAATDIFRAALADPVRPLDLYQWFEAPVAMGPHRWPVPVIDDMASLASWLGVTLDHLRWFADIRSLERSATDERLRHYRRRWVRKRDGSVRLLEAPKRETKDLQRMVLAGILDAIPVHDAAHGFRRGRSARTGAAHHVGADVVIRVDLASFFTAVTAGRVFGILRSAGYAEPVAHTLAALCTTVTPLAVRAAVPEVAPVLLAGRRRMLDGLRRPHLPQGSPTSPALANLAAFALDRRLAGLATALDARYTRYADDLVLSGGRRLRRSAHSVVTSVARIASDEGFRINATKTRVMAASQRQRVTGLVVNAGRNVARPDYDRLRAVLHDAAVNGPDHANRDGHPDFRAHLEGRIAWASADNPARAAKLAALAARIEW
ncbi:MAG: reverse transcriptase family protein [Actinomycetota bacterium]|nr:reverse transcriptase family protein [Actinomycetota bacterium]